MKLLKTIVIMLALTCLIIAANGQPIAGKTYTLIYNPTITGILENADRLWVVYVFDYWGTKVSQKMPGEPGERDLFKNVLEPDSDRVHKVALQKIKNVWQTEISIPGNAALLSYYFTDGKRCDYNDRKTYLTYIYGEDGRPVRNARFCNVDFMLLAGKDFGEIITEIQQEITAYPDNFLAYLVYWRFRFFNTKSLIGLKDLLTISEQYFHNLYEQYGDTVLNYYALSLLEIDRVIHFKFADQAEKPEVTELRKSLYTNFLKTLTEIPPTKCLKRVRQYETFARYMLLSPKEQKTQSQNNYAEMLAEFVGQPAPDFAFETTTNEKHRLTDFLGKYILLEFWGSWCTPCVAEIPYLAQAHVKYADHGLVIISISNDASHSKWDRNNLAEFAQQKGMTWIQVLDDSSNSIHKLYNIKFWPNLFLINPKGEVILRQGLRGEQLEKTLSKILGK